MAASLVSLRAHAANAAQQLGVLKEIASEGKAARDLLDIVPGFALGFASALRDSAARLSALAEHAARYQDTLRQMDEKARLHLLRFSKEVMTALRFPLQTP